MALSEKIIVRLGPGRYTAGGQKGLCLQVTKAGTRSWLLRYQIDKRERWMGLGPHPLFSLKEARERAEAERKKIKSGIDPLESKKSAKAARALEEAKLKTFAQAAQEYFDKVKLEWRSAKTGEQFLQTMDQYAYPIIGHLSVAAIDTGLVMLVLEQRHKNFPGQRLCDAITKTSDRLRKWIEGVLGFAAVRGYRAKGDNPAQWPDHLEHLLPKRPNTNHLAALSYEQLPKFYAELKARKGVKARALEFLILTAARSGEIIEAKRNEIEFETQIWTIPAIIKGGRQHEHHVPLPDRAMEILADLAREKGSNFVFSSAGQLEEKAMLKELRRMGYSATVHGFRSAFRTWSAERTAYPRELCEMVLSHKIGGDETERSYQRGEMLDKRRRLMADWATFCNTPAAEATNVTAIRSVS